MTKIAQQQGISEPELTYSLGPFTDYSWGEVRGDF